VTAAGLLLALLAAASQEVVHASDIDADEQVVLFPASARPAPGGGWLAPLHAWIFEPERDSAVRGRLLSALADSLDLPPGSADEALFRERAASFLADNERGQCLELVVAGLPCALPPSAADGHATAELRLPAGVAPDGAWLDVEASAPPGDARRHRGRVRLVPAQGLTVVSDIDDTLKVSEVRDLQALLRRTFLQAYEAVPGMAAVFAPLAEAGASFEYLSCSPWQLGPALLEFLRASGLPEGGLHLRAFRWKDERLLSLLAEPAAHKTPALQALLAAHPGRRLLLVGDSGETDPEIYGDFARAHPGVVAGILVRDVSAEPGDAPRWSTAFRDLPRDLWQVFRDAAELDVQRHAETARQCTQAPTPPDR